MAANGKKKNDALAKIGDGNALEAAAKLLMENVGAMTSPDDMGLGLLPRIKLTPGGVVGFTIDDVTDEGGEPTMIQGGDGFDGIILWSQPVRVFWATDFDERTEADNPAPECSSLDCIIGRGAVWSEDDTEVERQCAECQHAQWGSAAKGNGQACRTRTRQFVLPAGGLIPHIFELPTTSVRVAAQYGVGLANKGVSFHSVVTHFSAVGEKSADDIKYSKLTLSLAGELPPEAIEQLSVMRDLCASFASNVRAG